MYCQLTISGVIQLDQVKVLDRTLFWDGQIIQQIAVRVLGCTTQRKTTVISVENDSRP